ncbi:hypothetical protein CY35_11G074200 [Sphagnum magellanicum]|nr:hypothetical protein CY35_11G074200 [Sphagnum magellanicum]KAH9548151.1 hypothetical protein CY35_11G074200 [Sphagnum magellanicum]
MEEEVGTNSSSKLVYGTTPQHCQQMINHSLAHHPMVKFVRGALEKAGCPVGDKFFKPEECSMQVGGGFKRDDGDEVDVALTHELLHAYDHCRAANLDWTNCEHHACSEVCLSLFSFQQEKEFAVARCQSLYVCANVERFFLR